MALKLGCNGDINVNDFNIFPVFQEKQDPIIRKRSLPYLVHSTAFPQVSLFLASFWSTFWKIKLAYNIILQVNVLG